MNSQILCCCSDQSTALHVAAREGQVAAVRLLLQRGAEISLNKRHASFFHEALQHGRKDVINAIIDSDRSVQKTNTLLIQSTEILLLCTRPL